MKKQIYLSLAALMLNLSSGVQAKVYSQNEDLIISYKDSPHGISNKNFEKIIILLPNASDEELILSTIKDLSKFAKKLKSKDIKGDLHKIWNKVLEKVLTTKKDLPNHNIESEAKLETLKILFTDLKFDPNIKLENENTPLILAAGHQGPKSIKLLLANGADANIKNKNKETALEVAQKRLEEISKMALEEKSIVEAEDLCYKIKKCKKIIEILKEAQREQSKS